MEYYAAADKSPDPQFGAFRSEGWESTERCNSAQKSQVADNKGKKTATISLTQNSRKYYSGSVKKRDKPTIPVKLAFIPSHEEREIIRAAQLKLGVKKATEVVRMALKLFAEDAGLKVAG